MFAPHWSPDGRYITTQNTDGLKQALFNLKTQRSEELTSGTWVGYPNWSRDGKYVYYDAGSGDEPSFYGVRISDRKVERMGEPQRCPAGRNYRPWAGLAQDDSLLVLRDTGTQEIYALDVELP